MNESIVAPSGKCKAPIFKAVALDVVYVYRVCRQRRGSRSWSAEETVSFHSTAQNSLDRAMGVQAVRSGSKQKRRER